MAAKKTHGKAKTSKAAKVAKVAPKRGRGRPTDYKPAYAEQVRKLALLGLTDKGIANFFGVTEQTLNNWKHAHLDFFESLSAGKERADAEVAATLFRTAIGGGTVTEIREEPDSEGCIVRKKIIRELPPDVRAQRYILGNRHPKLWRDKVVVQDETPVETLTRTASSFISIMEAARKRQRQVLIDRGLSDGTG